MARLKRLSQIGGATIAILLCLSPTPARALTLAILDEPIVNLPGEGTESFNHAVGATSFSGEVTARTGLFTTRGVAFDLAVLELTNLDVINAGEDPVTLGHPTLPMLRLDHNFGPTFLPGDVMGFVFFRGSFIDSGPTSSVDPTDTITVATSFESEQPQPPEPTEVFNQMVQIQPLPGEQIVSFAASGPFSVTENQVNNRLTVVEFPNLVLGAGETNNLGFGGIGGVCVAMSDAPDFTEADAASICAIPEPSSRGFVLAAAALALGWGLRCKRKSTGGKVMG